MNIWTCGNWRNQIDTSHIKLRSGLFLRFQKGVDSEVRRSCIDFAKWLRSQYYFPIRIPIYFKASVYIKTQSGELVSAKIFEPYDIYVEPYITIATGNIIETMILKGNDNALAGVLGSIAHELTHYFQWINGMDLTEDQAERQANNYRKKLIGEYAQTRDHP